MRWIVLLRAVNVGGSGKLAMAELRESLAQGGAGNVATYIQSGNIVMDHPLETREEVADWTAALIERHFGFRPGAIALTPADLAGALQAVPFAPEADPKTVLVHFCDRAPDPKAPEALATYCTNEEHLELVGTCLFLHAPNGIGRSKLNGRIEPALGCSATARNLNSLRKIQELA
ncbi:DUF1697 domain-containing protein [Pseudooceanicola sp. HF7]|uniref:DUF1697 domain-containing protein n=1 Tax=Pseudooceanicola sp. HF7 TaxID=2721560 RepID=UPI00143135B3|nr:DUF1697 domain-containing protein [Pseudooceanicola sp. HF7]NIZ09851.1 DUF1697 domain-containing protein [Pseudooceanicola sp. HF7]